MNYLDFMEKIVEEIRNKLGEEYEVLVNEVMKNNGICLQGLTIRRTDSKISPTIYLNSYFDRYQNGETMESIVEDIHMLKEHSAVNDELDVDFFYNYEKVRECVVYKLVNHEQNQKLLEDVPHVDYLDLAIVFYCIISEEIISNATILIHNSHLKIWNVDCETLYKEALKNTPKLLTYDLRCMQTVVLELLNMREKQEDECEEDLQALKDYIEEDPSKGAMYVLSNKNKLFGAACLNYPNVLKAFADSIESDLFILPSSVHEVILVPMAEGLEEENLSNMVKEVNETQVEPAEVLSDHAYFFSRAENRIMCKSC